jgi:septal ring factor EnvC (AmiA/AmiB activator)
VTTPAGPEPPLDALPPDAPATVEDVRAGRRWTIVALVWAVAASAIAVIALIQANDNSNNNNSSDQPAQTSQGVSPKDFADFQKQVNDRLDAFSRRLNDTASQADLQKIDKRLTQVEDDLTSVKNDSGKQSDSITQIQSDVKDLQQRVDNLESQQSGGGGTTTTP